ncbi:MAG TPA: dihydrolipoamide acetyltransferase family protein, partial [Gemmatimonadaceae bacterium]|nr:dihydrolipoamide acetyltransferase family protein [Gemmatimonadaceae bacterium]
VVPPVPAIPAPAPAATDAARAMRQAVAAAVSRSKREIPHYYLSTDVDLSKALAWLAEANGKRPIAERVLPAALLVKSVAVALRSHPDLNAAWADGALQLREAINVGIAVSMRGGGLITPAIHNTDTLPVDTLMGALSDLVRRARTGGLRTSEMTDATITVSNLGDEGVTSLFGIIYPPQVALVGFGSIAERPWAERGALSVRPVVTVTLAADHRATDGHYGSRFLRQIARLLQTPEAL